MAGKGEGEDPLDINIKFVKLHGLLNEVKSTVEGLLSTPTSNVWNIYGGLKRLSTCVENILNHRLKYSQTADGSSSLDFHHFVKSLHWLNPVLIPSSERIRQRANDDKISEGQAWLRQSLQSHTMSAQLRALVGDKQNLLQSYYDDAFLCQPDYFQALCICLEAVEQNQPALLTNINHNLLVGSRRSLSFISTQSKPRSNTDQGYTSSSPRPISGTHQVISMMGRSTQADETNMGIVDKLLDLLGIDLTVLNTNDPLTDKIIPNNILLRRSDSEIIKADRLRTDSVPQVASEESMRLDSILNSEGFDEQPNEVAISTSNGLASPKNKGKQPMKKPGHGRSKSDMSFLKAAQPIDNESSQSYDQIDGRGTILSSSLPDNDSAMEERIRNASFLENGGTMISQANECYFPQPRQGESLKSFLSSQDFDTCAELDRENAHFAISEALIAAIEHMKWNQVLRPIEDTAVLDDLSGEESDEEILKLKEKIQERRRMKKKSIIKRKSSSLLSSSLASSGATPKSSSHSGSLKDSDSIFSNDSTDDLYAHSLSDTDSLLTLRDGITLSDRLSMDSGSMVISAEQVALSLLSNFDELHLPKASELQWLVSEKDAPQALLPLPNSLPISPDDVMEGRKGTRIRGNAEWAPPRAQIIFNVHPTPKRRVLISKQNYRCAGCGMKIEPGYIKRFRYCDYLGKYFCQCCHSNALSNIPAKILHKWDFTKYYVSNFAHELLDRMSGDPLFNIMDINSKLIKKVKSIERLTLLRVQLKAARPFLASCRQGNQCYEEMLKQSSYIMDDVHLYSLTDLLKVKSGELEKSLNTLLAGCVAHITSCELCRAKGFICEICDKEQDILFPFQLLKVTKCHKCQACYHQQCYARQGKICPKCLRREHRKTIIGVSEHPNQRKS